MVGSKLYISIVWYYYLALVDDLSNSLSDLILKSMMAPRSFLSSIALSCDLEIVDMSRVDLKLEIVLSKLLDKILFSRVHGMFNKATWFCGLHGAISEALYECRMATANDWKLLADLMTMLITYLFFKIVTIKQLIDLLILTLFYYLTVLIQISVYWNNFYRFIFCK